MPDDVRGLHDDWNRRRRWIAWAVLATAACSNGGAGPGADAGTDGGSPPRSAGGGALVPQTDEERFLANYAAAVCAMYEPCCEAEGMGYDQAGCAEWYGKIVKGYFPGSFRKDKAQACLAALDAARSADAQRCSTVKDFAEATLRAECKDAFAPPERTGKGLGESCMLSGDCASSPEGPVTCYGHVCLLQLRGKAGDGPCYFGAGDGVDRPTRGYTCEAKDGLYCDRSMNACAPQVEDGGYCPFGNACKPSALCSGGRCETLPGPGERCLNAIPGAGGFCREGSACDPVMLTCGDPLPVGAHCREPAQCESRACMEGTCVKPEFTRALNCTGGR